MKRIRVYEQGNRLTRGAKRMRPYETAPVVTGTFNPSVYYSRNRFRGHLARRRKVVLGTKPDQSFVDLAAAVYALDSTGSITLINTIAQGASVNQRIGKKVMIKSIQARGLMAANSAGVSNDVAYLIVHDKRPGGALPAITDILNTATQLSFNNDDNSSRFTILKRVDVVMNGGSAGTITSNTAMNADFFMNVNRPQVFNSAGTGAIGDIDSGAIYLVTVGGNVPGTTAASITIGFRIRFQDV